MVEQEEAVEVPKGWGEDPARHSLAARGVQTSQVQHPILHKVKIAISEKPENQIFDLEEKYVSMNEKWAEMRETYDEAVEVSNSLRATGDNKLADELYNSASKIRARVTSQMQEILEKLRKIRAANPDDENVFLKCGELELMIAEQKRVWLR